MWSSVLTSVRKRTKPSHYRKYGSAEKIQSFVNKYLNKANNIEKLSTTPSDFTYAAVVEYLNKANNIEKLLITPSDFTYAAVVEYMQNNRNMYIDYGDNTIISDSYGKICRAYNQNENEHFFYINQDLIFESKYEKLSFKHIKCLWVFYELLKILRAKDKDNPMRFVNWAEDDDNVISIVNLFEDKINNLQKALEGCHANQYDIRKVLGVTDLEYLLTPKKRESTRRSKRVAGGTKRMRFLRI